MEGRAEKIRRYAEAGGFDGQFHLAAASGHEAPAGFLRRRLGSWVLATHPGLPVCEIRSADDSLVGWLVGWAIADAGVLIEEIWRVPLACDAPDAEAFERHLYSVGGRYACVLVTRTVARLYLDPAGTLAAVYALEEKVVASTTGLLAHGAASGAYYGGYSDWRPGFNQFFAAGTTSNARMGRLMPNHYLDLNRWCPVRHWLAEPIPRVSAGEVGGVVEAIWRRLQKQTLAVVRRYPTYLTLTAGVETRSMLACCRGSVGEVSFVTFSRGSGGALIDGRVAAALARRFGLRHQAVPKAKAPGVGQEYRIRIGYDGGAGKAAYFLEAARRHLDMGRAFMSGHAGGLWRGYYWWRFERVPAELGLGDLLRAMEIEGPVPFEGALANWLECVSRRDPHFLLDQMFLEQRFGCWASPHLYGFAPFVAKVAPFCHREIYRAMLSLPIEYRDAGRLAPDVITALWPELLELPINPETFGPQPGEMEDG